MQRFSRNSSFLRRVGPRVGSNAIRHHSTPAVMEQVEYQYQDGYLDVLEYTAAENQFGNYFKQCLAKEGVNYQRLESAGYQLMMDEREFDPPASPRPDSPAWAYMYGNNLVDFKTQMENLTPDKEFKRGFFKHRVEALEKKLRMHFPQLDWQARYARRQRQWSTDKQMSVFARAKAEELAKAVAEDEARYVEQYRSNSHFNFGADDPFEYYMPTENEEKWLAHQRFEWDQTSRNADRQPYMDMLGKLTAFLEPKLKNVPLKAVLGNMLTAGNAEVFAAFNTACPSTTTGGEKEVELKTQRANVKKAVDSFTPAQLATALTFGNLPDLFAQFFVKPGSLDAFLKDNDAALTDVAASHAGLVAAGAKMDKAITDACAAIQKAAEGAGATKNSGLAAFLANGGLEAAALEVLKKPEAHGLAQNLQALAETIKGNSFLGYVHCMAAATVLSRPNLATDVYAQATYGSRGNAVNVVGQAAAVPGFADAVGRQVSAFLSDSTPDVQEAASGAVELEGVSEELNAARQANDSDWLRLKLDYGLADLASLSIQYKY